MRPLKPASGSEPAVSPTVSPAIEESLDPQDWSSLRSVGHQMVDDMLSYLETVRQRPAWQPMPSAVRTAFETPLPRGPEAPTEVYKDFQENVLQEGSLPCR